MRRHRASDIGSKTYLKEKIIALMQNLNSTFDQIFPLFSLSKYFTSHFQLSNYPNFDDFEQKFEFCYHF